MPVGSIELAAILFYAYARPRQTGADTGTIGRHAGALGVSSGAQNGVGAG